ncbi:MAG: hypothetical protein WBG41_02255 [Acidimicrobiales bacterium]
MAGNVGLGAASGEAALRREAPPMATSALGARWLIRDTVLTGLACGLVVLPFVVAVVRLLSESASHLTLTDDLALIDLHTRQAIAWQQQLGVFDRNGWNHPGPAYFYILGVVYRIFGSNGRSLFVGATLINGASAVFCIAVVRRWTTATRALWAALAIGVLAFALAASGHGSTTYSETVLGALVSPWNPLIVIFPLLLLLLLCAGAMDRSALSAVGVLVVGSFVVQTDISTLPLVAMAVVVAEATWVVGEVRRRRGLSSPPTPVRNRGMVGRALIAVGLVLFVVMWVPPIIQQITNHPGNMTLLYRYFTSGRAGHSWSTAFGAAAAASAVLVVGPSEVMLKALQGSQPHQVLAALVLVVTMALSLASAVVGFRARSRFGAALGLLGLLGCVAVVVGVTHVIGHLYGYLVMWAVVLPVVALVAAGAVGLPRPWSAWLVEKVGPAIVRLVLVALVVVTCFASVARVVTMPPLSAASDPEVAQLVALITPHLRPGETVAVNDGRAGTSQDDVLINIERFLGLVNALDRDGYKPQVNKFWLVEVGPGYFDNGTAARSVLLTTWTPASPSRDGYLGRVGDMAVLIGREGEFLPPPS